MRITKNSTPDEQDTRSFPGVTIGMWRNGKKKLFATWHPSAGWMECCAKTWNEAIQEVRYGLHAARSRTLQEIRSSLSPTQSVCCSCLRVLDADSDEYDCCGELLAPLVAGVPRMTRHPSAERSSP